MTKENQETLWLSFNCLLLTNCGEMRDSHNKEPFDYDFATPNQIFHLNKLQTCNISWKQCLLLLPHRNASSRKAKQHYIVKLITDSLPREGLSLPQSGPRFETRCGGRRKSEQCEADHWATGASGRKHPQGAFERWDPTQTLRLSSENRWVDDGNVRREHDKQDGVCCPV